jgi:hypothetical protein
MTKEQTAGQRMIAGAKQALAFVRGHALEKGPPAVATDGKGAYREALFR